MTRCRICGDPVDPFHHQTWQLTLAYTRVAGVRVSGKHGGRDFRGPYHDQQEWAHDHCLDKARAGLLGQETIAL